MNDSASAFPVRGLQQPDLEVGKGSGKTSAAGAAAAEHFQALLKNLEEKAAALGERSRAELEPEELSAAVDQARSSFQDALALQDQLLEAWRQSQHQSPEGSDGPAGNASGRGPA